MAGESVNGDMAGERMAGGVKSGKIGKMQRKTGIDPPLGLGLVFWGG